MKVAFKLFNCSKLTTLIFMQETAVPTYIRCLRVTFLIFTTVPVSGLDI